MENLVFAIDVDGVLRNNLITMLRLYNENFNDSKKIEDITHFKTDISFPRIKEETGIKGGDWFFKDHSKELFEYSDSYPYVEEDIKLLQEYGKVILVTYQKSFENKAHTLKWIERHNINPDGICFLKDKSIVNADFFIDDNELNIENCNAKNGILIDAPYNINIDIGDLYNKSKNCGNVARCKSFHDFVITFKKYIENEI